MKKMLVVCPSPRQSGKVMTVFAILAVVISGSAAFFAISSRSQKSGDAALIERRQEAFDTASQKMAQDKDWPATPEILITEFWYAASRKDYQRMVLLCPGSVAEDFKKYYDQWPPSPAKEIAALPGEPQKPGVNYYRVKVPFPNFPNKTIKMAICQGPQNRLVIDGQHTIWW